MRVAKCPQLHSRLFLTYLITGVCHKPRINSALQVSRILRSLINRRAVVGKDDYLSFGVFLADFLQPHCLTIARPLGDNRCDLPPPSRKYL